MAEQYKLAGIELQSPLINGAGSINGTSKDEILQRVDELCATGIGAVVFGSMTVPRQEGNILMYGDPVYFHRPKTGETWNAMGLPNIGLDEAVMLLEEITNRANAVGKPVIASASPTKPSSLYGSVIEQSVELIYTLVEETNVDVIELNVSCPNIVDAKGGRKPILGYDNQSMVELLEAIYCETGFTEKLIGIKLPPYITTEQQQVVPEIARLLNQAEFIDFITVSNTIPNQIPLNNNGDPILSVPGGAGGMSGPATKDVGRDQLRLWKDLARNELDIISMLGVDSGKELAVRRRLGATAAGGVTFLWESNDWKKAVTDVLTEYADVV